MTLLRNGILGRIALAAAVAVCGAVAQSASAATITATASGGARSDNTVSDNEWTGRFNSTTDGSAVFTFLLPAVAPADITAASFSLNYTGTGFGTPTFNADLSALPTRSGSAVVAADRTATGTAIADNFTTPSTGTGVLNTGDSTALLAFVQANYAAGQYLVLRLSPDGADLSANVTGRYQYSGFDDAIAASRPTLTLTVVPEPASLSLLGLAGLGMIRRRRA